MRKPFLLLFAVVALAANAQTPTWSSDIAQIMYSNCTICHRSGGLAPFSLMDYSDAYSHRFNVADKATTREMPPWPPDANYVRLAHERLLSATDIQKINNWVAGGAPIGDTTQAPAKPVYPTGSTLGTVNLSLTIPTFTVPANQNGDLYQCFTIPSGLLQNKSITAMEIVPGNGSIVHHVLVYQDTTGTCAQLDSNAAGPGYTNFGGVGSNKAILVGGWVPGMQPYRLPQGLGIKLYANTDIVLQIHYPAGSAGQSDSTKVNFQLTTNPVRQVFIDPALNHIPAPTGSLVNGPLYIPANQVKTFESHYKLPNANVSILTVGPHSHLISKSWLCYAVTPTTDTIPLIRINDWDFHWQGFYQFRNVLKLPANSDLYGFCTYDNTSNNEDNPNNPPQAVSLGEATTDEMMLVYFSYMLYQPGDENIAMDTTALVNLTDTVAQQPNGINEAKGIVSTAQLYAAEPNPANNQTRFSYFLTETGNTTLCIYDLDGRLVEELKVPQQAGFNSFVYNTAALQPGTYLYSLRSGAVTRTKQLVITH